jgi:hypothetical protein
LSAVHGLLSMVVVMKVRCPHCSVVIKVPAGWNGPEFTCPGCKVRVSMPEDQTPPPLPLPDDDRPVKRRGPTEQRRRWHPVLKWGLIALGFHILVAAELVAVGAILYYRPSARAEREESRARLAGWESERKRDQEVRKIVQDAVRRDLKSPLTAKFEDYAHVRHSQTDTDVYVVSGEVHSQNAFGAMLKGYYSGKVRKHSDGWTLVGSVIVSTDYTDTLVNR